MRQVVAVEGKKTENGQLIKPGALYPDSDGVPVYAMIGLTYREIGYAYSFERSDGEVSFEIATGEPYDFERASANINIVGDYHHEGDTLIVERGLIRAIMFVNALRMSGYDKLQQSIDELED